MLRVRLLSARVEQGGASYAFGEIIDVPKPEALRMIDSGLAEAFDPRRAETEMRSGGRNMMQPAAQMKERG